LTFLTGSPRAWGMAAASLVLVLGPAGVAQAQAPSPTPSPPPRLFQDELDLQANANVVQGSGARAFGMGGAFLARADDATAASWNPAGLSYLRAPEVSFVWVHADLGDQRHDSTGQIVESDHGAGQAPDFLAFTYPFEIGSVSGAAQLSFQRVLSFDSDRTIAETALPDPSQPNLPPRVRLVSSSGGFDVLALGSGWQLSRGLRLGVTVNRWFDGYDRTVQVPAPREIPTRQNSKFNISGWNFHFGVIWSPWQSLNLGAVFKTAFKADATLARSRIDFFVADDGSQTQTTNAYARNDLSLNFPEAAGVGASWRPRSNLTLSVDYTRTRWSRGRIYNFFTLPRTEVDQEPPVPRFPKDFFPVLPYPTLDDPEQQDSSQLRAGFEYVVIWKRLKWPVRAGYFGDDQYFRAVGGAPRFTGLTVGTGLIVGPALLDVAYIRETGKYTSIDGLRHDVVSNRVYASVIYRHRRKP
jgi:long-chain fatty acid transport protein